MPETNSGIIILAAGSSSRLGTPKQLLMFNNKTLLQHAIDEAVVSENGEVIVVTGANQDDTVSSLSTSNVRFIYNEQWQQGMASSMQEGLSALLITNPSLSSVIIMLCDQPFVSAQLLKDMIVMKDSTGKGIIACSYNEITGVPALFSQPYFDALLSLKGSEGAKKIIAKHADDVAVLSFPLGAIDIDTKEDYHRLIK